MKPFLFLGTRAEDDVADGEYAAVLGFSGLDEGELHPAPAGGDAAARDRPDALVGDRARRRTVQRQ